jgi:hypothetical protein
MNIYDELRSGASAEDLVARFTAQLNEAEARIKQEEAEEEAAKTAKAEAKRNDMIDAMEALVTAIERHYPDLLEGETVDVESIEAMADLAIMMLDMHSIVPVKAPKVTKAKTTASRASEDIFADFFKAFGL